MKFRILYFLNLICFLSYAQNPEIKTELPNVIPPSPTVAALMKFEEIPVSNYTGIPDVTIPLYNSPTLSKDINFNLALKYHSGVGADDRASDVGLGWSLIAGGTISRTVRGLPDEILNVISSNNDKIGLYHNNISGMHKNNYYYFTEHIANVTQDFYKPFNQLSTYQKEIGDEFLWTAANTSIYDSEHDLWQFNFLGNSGRFYIRKNVTTNQLEIVPLDDYRIKIINHYSNIQNNQYVPTGFTVFDEKGYKYVFDVKETTENKFATRTFNPDNDNLSADKIFYSSFHLSKIYDNNDELIIEYFFKSEHFVESYSNISINKNNFDYNANGHLLVCFEFPAEETISNSTSRIDVKKIDYINIVNGSKIFFEFIKGRQDTNINLKSETAFLNSITIKDNDLNFIKKYNLEYDYSTTLYNRMLLKSIKEYDHNQNIIIKAIFDYKVNDTYGKIIGRDNWGFLNLIKECEVTTLNHKNTSPEFSTTNLLEKISYPTGGYVKFDFESNTYSYIGNNEILNYFEGEHNINLSNNTYHTFNNSNTSLYLGVLSSNYKKLIFGPSIFVEDVSSATRNFILKKKVNGNWVSAGNVMHCKTENCCIDFYPEIGVEYKIDYLNLDLQYSSNETLSILYYSISNNVKEFLYGGGNRIKSIAYFDSLDINSPPKKIKYYNYNFFNNSNKSSGSLAFPKPIFEYNLTVASNHVSGYQGFFECSKEVNDVFSFDTYTSNNNFVSLKTSGSDVGYKEVTVFEEELGKTEYIYTSPIDHPEENIPSGIPFIPTKNYDYKRGLLLNEKTYDTSSKIISEINNDYEIVDFVNHTGTRFVKPYGVCYTGSLFKNFTEYKLKLNNGCIPCNFNTYMDDPFLCGLPLDLEDGLSFKPRIMPHPIFEAYGWAKLKNKTTKNYFYSNGSSTPKIVETFETYTYNPLNKKISESTVTNSQNETLTTKYFYHSGNSIHSQNRIAEIERIETYRGSELLSKSKINYNNNWTNNVSYLPQTIQTAKAGEAYENRLHYLQYDAFGHPLEVKQEDGMHICYIWGYNQTQPIAKIENATYAQVLPHVANLQTLSNGNNEQNLISALNNLRTLLPNAMITTYTYKPLIGISTVTDPKGDKQTYHYDTFNRLEFVKDKDGNILSENKYHYRTQN